MISFDNVAKRYPNGREALAGVSSTIQPGEFVFLTGRSGAGKSSVLKLIALLERPSRGTVTVERPEHRQDQGRQDPGVSPRHRRGVPGSQAAARPAHLRQRRAAAGGGRHAAQGSRPARARRARPGRVVRPRTLLAARTVGGRTAARRHRARGHQQAAAADRRRAHRQSRPGAWPSKSCGCSSASRKSASP